MITYVATNTLNGKFYIGSTINFQRRKEQHLYTKRKGEFSLDLRTNPELFEWETWEDSSGDPVMEQALLEMWVGKTQCYNKRKDARRPRKGFKSGFLSETSVKGRTKPVKITNIDTGETMVFKSLGEAADTLRVSKGNLSSTANNKRTHASRYKATFI
jgi:hypothetical protein